MDGARLGRFKAALKTNELDEVQEMLSEPEPEQLLQAVLEKWGETPLHIAASQPTLELLDCLLKQIASTATESEAINLVNRPAKGNSTPLHRAYHKGNFDHAERLLEAKADPTQRTTGGRYPCAYNAVEWLHRDCGGVRTRDGVDKHCIECSNSDERRRCYSRISQFALRARPMEPDLMTFLPESKWREREGQRVDEQWRIRNYVAFDVLMEQAELHKLTSEMVAKLEGTFGVEPIPTQLSALGGQLISASWSSNSVALDEMIEFLQGSGKVENVHMVKEVQCCLRRCMDIAATFFANEDEAQKAIVQQSAAWHHHVQKHMGHASRKSHFEGIASILRGVCYLNASSNAAGSITQLRDFPHCTRTGSKKGWQIPANRTFLVLPHNTHLPSLDEIAALELWKQEDGTEAEWTKNTSKPLSAPNPRLYKRNATLKRLADKATLCTMNAWSLTNLPTEPWYVQIGEGEQSGKPKPRKRKHTQSDAPQTLDDQTLDDQDLDDLANFLVSEDLPSMAIDEL